MRFLRANAADALAYLFLSVGTLFVAGVFAVVLATLNAARVGSLVGLLVVSPLLDLVKTALYADHATGRIPTSPASAGSARERLVRELRSGLGELRAFVRATPALQAVSAAVFALGIAAGWRVAAGADAYFRASIATRASGWFPPTMFLNLAANNWLVGATQAYAGFLAGVPAITSLVFNGLNIGVLYRLEVDKAELLLFIAPHGVIELPALIVSGALGLYLGTVGVGAVRGRTDRETVAAAVERAYRVLIGLLVAFLVAAFVEAFVSPYYDALLGL